MPSEGRVLVVDDHVEMARLLADHLTDAGYTVDVATSGQEAIAAVRGRVLDAVVCDLRMEQVDGFDVLAAVRQADPTLPVLIMTAFGGVENAVEAMRRGATHYFTKPFRLDEVLLYVQRAIAERRLREENRALRQAVGDRSSYAALIGHSDPMRALYELIERVAHSPAPVLVRGESGSGKELVARALHFEGPRKDGPLVAVNCTSIPNALLESELFGQEHPPGTPEEPRPGLFEVADGGTLFLDEIGDMAPELQAKLLRVLEDGEVRAVGADASRKVDVRVVAATHQELESRVREGRFRQDLFYRLNVVPLLVPPLRERREDIPLLVEHFVAQSRKRNPRARLSGFSPEALAALATAPWPGNVRELENLVERLAVVTVQETVDLPTLQLHAPAVTADAHPLSRAQARLMPLRQLEGEYIAYVVAQCGGNKTKAAEILGIDVSTIHRRERERSGNSA
ncbi:sigma-54-dependent transcriptional regulator [Archangium sp.]|uniref:sigma-54-dependent transcriptional regulator n=1 Tax=Archangium sp. TaxID=1872627 RepID=UPI003899E67B